MKIVEFAFVVYPATDLARSRAFYEGVLGLTSATSFNEGNQFWIEYEIGPHTLGIGNEPFLKPSGDGPHLGWKWMILNKRSTTSDVRKCSLRLSLLTRRLSAERRSSWTLTVTNSASTKERPFQSEKSKVGVENLGTTDR